MQPFVVGRCAARGAEALRGRRQGSWPAARPRRGCRSGRQRNALRHVVAAWAHAVQAVRWRLGTDPVVRIVANGQNHHGSVGVVEPAVAVAITAVCGAAVVFGCTCVPRCTGRSRRRGDDGVVSRHGNQARRARRPSRAGPDCERARRRAASSAMWRSWVTRSSSRW